MTRHTLRSTLGTSLIVVVLALVTVTVAANYAGAYFDVGNGGGGTVATPTAGWSDLMGVLEACAAGSACSVTVASGGQTYQWTSEGPLLALAGATVCEAADPARAPGGTHVADVTPNVGAHKLTP